jgi:hypothetical protein
MRYNCMVAVPAERADEFHEWFAIEYPQCMVADWELFDQYTLAYDNDRILFDLRWRGERRFGGDGKRIFTMSGNHDFDDYDRGLSEAIHDWVSALPGAVVQLVLAYFFLAVFDPLDHDAEPNPRHHG